MDDQLVKKEILPRDSRADLLRRIALISYVALFILIFGWYSVLVTDPVFPRSISMIILLGPLIFPIRGILYGKAYTHAWAGLLMVIYICHGVVLAVGDSAIERSVGWIETLLALSFVLSSAFYAKHEGQRLGLSIRKKKKKK